ncbi:hypothetical protein ACFPA8_18760 [Streptomyces ovatisporus]|uniref:Prepilin-type N-terminal cleavage/methylation domain-containing protein n=1 Tax=Streptomyces ovatisporus TaxID=1128682 RepID=A0ABV9AB21_9ACTN
MTKYFRFPASCATPRRRKFTAAEVVLVVVLIIAVIETDDAGAAALSGAGLLVELFYLVRRITQQGCATPAAEPLG